MYKKKRYLNRLKYSQPAYNSEDELLKPFTKDTMEVEEV
jgi:hypothetical protein